MIALTRGQLRRRWRASVLTLLAMLPWYALLTAPVLMAFIIKDNKFVLNKGHFALGTCADCCGGGGGGCSGCISSNACACSDATPTQWTLTLSGNTSCTGTNYNGTYVIPQIPPGGSFCLFRYTDATVTIDIGRSSASMSVVFSDNAFGDVFACLIQPDSTACCISRTAPDGNFTQFCSGGNAGFGGSVLITPC